MTPHRQWVKWTVYALLFFDFVLYLIQDAGSARYTQGADPALFDYARAYVTSIDLAAWLLLVLLFELETYVLVGRRWSGGRQWAVHGLRLFCSVVILHTSYANAVALREFQAPRGLPASADACAYADSGWSFLRNRDYIDLDRGNCAAIGRGPEFFAIGDERVLTDRGGLREGLVLAWTDLAESIAWLLVVLATELAVRIKRTAGRTAAAASLAHLKMALYVLILVIALYWGSKQQFLYLWDELIWIFGFLLIDRNIHDWQPAPRAGPLNPALNASV